MSNTAATRRGLTRLASVVTVTVLRVNASGLTLLSLLVLSASGCGNNSGVPPTAPGPVPPAPPPVPATAVKVEGRVLDEHNEPVAGARILALRMPGGAVPGTTADDTGSFSLTVDWPANWPGISLQVYGDGYETADVHVQATEAHTVRINIYRSLRISPEESIQATLSIRSTDSWWEPFSRRVVVIAPPGKPIDIEVVPEDGQDYAGLAIWEQLQWGHNFPSRVTVPGGLEVWIVVRQLGRVTLRAVSRE